MMNTIRSWILRIPLLWKLTFTSQTIYNDTKLMVTINMKHLLIDNLMTRNLKPLESTIYLTSVCSRKQTNKEVLKSSISNYVQ